MVPPDGLYTLRFPIISLGAWMTFEKAEMEKKPLGMG